MDFIVLTVKRTLKVQQLGSTKCGMRNRDVIKSTLNVGTCSRTTPAYKNKVEAISQWEDQWEIAQDPDDILNKN